MDVCGVSLEMTLVTKGDGVGVVLVLEVTKADGVGVVLEVTKADGAV